jgi:hypothetical protein
MLMRIAIAYTGRSRHTLQRAVRDGVLQAAGRNGRTLVFDRSELDRWMVGSDLTAPEQPPRAISRTQAPAASSAALDRLRALTASGGR